MQFGAQKCKKLHVGKVCDDFKCQKLEVDEWKEVEVIPAENVENVITQQQESIPTTSMHNRIAFPSRLAHQLHTFIIPPLSIHT